MKNQTEVWNQIKEDSIKFGYYQRLTPHIKALFKITEKFLSEIKTETVLDVGAGDTKYKDHISCSNYISLDISGNEDIIADASTLPFKKNSIDMIISTQVLEHVKNPFLVVKEFSRVLKVNGILFISVPTVMYLHETPNDYFRYTKYGIEYLLNQNNIKIDKFETVCSGYIVGIELLFIGIYSSIYRIIKPKIVRKFLVNIISYLSLIILRLDFTFFRTIFPGNIILVAYKVEKD